MLRAVPRMWPKLASPANGKKLARCLIDSELKHCGIVAGSRSEGQSKSSPSWTTFELFQLLLRKVDSKVGGVAAFRPSDPPNSRYYGQVTAYTPSTASMCRDDTVCIAPDA